MKDKFYIYDTKKNRFFSGWDNFIPWICNCFVESLHYAKAYDSKEMAEEAVKRYNMVKTEEDGNTPLDPTRLSVVQVKYEITRV